MLPETSRREAVMSRTVAQIPTWAATSFAMRLGGEGPVWIRNVPTASEPVALATYEEFATKKLSRGAVGNSSAMAWLREGDLDQRSGVVGPSGAG